MRDDSELAEVEGAVGGAAAHEMNFHNSTPIQFNMLNGIPSSCGVVSWHMRLSRPCASGEKRDLAEAAVMMKL